MNKYEVFIKSKNGEVFGFYICGNDNLRDELEEHGFKVDRVCNTIPANIQRLGLTSLWVWLQDKGFISY